MPFAKTTFRTGFTPALWAHFPSLRLCNITEKTQTRPWWLKPSAVGEEPRCMFGIMKGSSFWLWREGWLMDFLANSTHHSPLFPRYNLSSITKRNLYWIVLWQAINIQKPSQLAIYVEVLDLCQCLVYILAQRYLFHCYIHIYALVLVYVNVLHINMSKENKKVITK
jgi:hypothetical protein